MRVGKGQIKRSRQDRIWWSREGKEEKERNVWAHQRRVTFVTGKVLENDCKHRQEWLKKKGQAAEEGVVMSGLEETEVLMVSYEDNTSQGKSWIFDSGSTIHVCSQKELFNFLVAKEEKIVKMVGGSACEVISTKTVKVA